MCDGDEGGNETIPPEADMQRAGVASTGHNAIHSIQTNAAALQAKQAERQQSDRQEEPP